MWIVQLALKRPYTFIVAALLILLVSPLVILQTPTDIFPNINIPVIAVLWNYTGFSAQEMADRITTPFERTLTTTVNDIDHIESQSLRDRDVVKIYFHQGAKVDLAYSQVTSISQTLLHQLPNGTTAPLILSYNASSVPVLQLGLSSDTLSEQELNDWGLNFIRTQLVTVPGVGIPYPYGGKMAQVSVDLNLPEMQANHVSPEDVLNALNAQNLILPGGTAKIGSLEYDVAINGSPDTIEGLNDLPVRQVNGATIYIRDVAHVRRGFQIQTNIVRKDGRRGVLMPIMKTGNTSTIDIVDGVKKRLPMAQALVPPELKITPLFDQSIFVRAAVSGVVREAVIAACLTALMILLFLGSWRSTVIIAISIPLAILSSILCLSALGETINLMTLGGLSLAVGMLVDDATVSIENINRHLEDGEPLHESILEGSRQIAIPAFVSTLCICIVFIPMFLLSGVARYLFVPLAEAVVFAMIASYILSRTLVPTMAMYLLGHDHHHTKPKGDAKEQQRQQQKKERGPGFFKRLQIRFEEGFTGLRDRYSRSLGSALHHRFLFGAIFLGFCLASLLLVPFLGQDFFPDVDAGQMSLHVRGKTGLRIEDMAALCDKIENRIRQEIPEKELGVVIDNIGLPYSSINTAYANNGTVGPADAQIMISLNEHHHATAGYVRQLRKVLPEAFPGTQFYFQPADIVTQILNFGLPSPIDIQIAGRDQGSDAAVANDLAKQLALVPGAVDVHLQQVFDLPHFEVAVNRTKANQLGFTEQDVTNSLLVALSGSGQVAPTFWLNPQNGVNYNLVAQMPDYSVDSLQTLQNIPVTSATNPNVAPQILGNLASFTRTSIPGVVTHYNVMPTVDIYAANQDRDLGGVAAATQKLVDQVKSKLPHGSTIQVKGQVQTMHDSFFGLGIGLIGAIILVYLLIVVNFQSWSDPFIIITALPGALAGIVWMLFVTGTTLNVPSMMGSIMCIGVATANSILVISFANELMETRPELSALDAALEAGTTRLRPVLMTALAMIIGMVPMSFGLGEGGEQNAPLARAVIGGLLFATVATLFFVPVVFTMIRQNKKRKPSEDGKASGDGDGKKKTPPDHLKLEDSEPTLALPAPH